MYNCHYTRILVRHATRTLILSTFCSRQAQPDSLVGSDLQPLSVDDLRVPFVLILVLLLVCLAVMPLEAFCFRGSSQ